MDTCDENLEMLVLCQKLHRLFVHRPITDKFFSVTGLLRRPCPHCPLPKVEVLEPPLNTRYTFSFICYILICTYSVEYVIYYRSFHACGLKFKTSQVFCQCFTFVTALEHKLLLQPVAL